MPDQTSRSACRFTTPAPVEFDNPRLTLATGTAGVLPINPASITGLAINEYNQPASYQYSLGVQHSLGARTVVSLSYVGNTRTATRTTSGKSTCPTQSALIPLINGVPGVNYNTLPGLPYPGFHSINLSTNEANSHYNGLQLDINSQVGKDLFLRAFYTYSKTIDPVNGSTAGTTGGTGGGDLQNVSNPYLGWRYDEGPSGFDKTHNAVVNFIYDIPAFRHNENRLAPDRHRRMGSLRHLELLFRHYPSTSGLTGAQGGNALPNATNRPDLVSKVGYPQTVSASGQQVIQYVDPSAFANPAIGAFGDLGHNAIRGPGRDNWNMSLFKSFVFSEARGSRLEFRVETFNIWNHTQFNTVSNNFGASDFGQFKTAFDPRILQIGLKLYF